MKNVEERKGVGEWAGEKDVALRYLKVRAWENRRKSLHFRQ